MYACMFGLGYCQDVSCGYSDPFGPSIIFARATWWGWIDAARNSELHDTRNTARPDILDKPLV